ncbi:MAG: sugar phosphate isomerase/epimerase [Bryobacteraceae bacterium]|jgi:sugar phosphate isomerase/epimerase
MLRRTLLQTFPASGLAAAEASGADVPIKLGFDSYSVRAFGWKAPQLLDYAAGLKLDAIQLSSLGDYESLDTAYLQKIRDQAARLGIAIDAGMGCICPSSGAFDKNGPPARDQLLAGLRAAKAVGATCLRCYMGTSADRTGPIPLESHMQNTIDVFRSVRPEAMDLGVKIAQENHSGDLQALELKTIIEESGKDFVAACMDLGNPIWVVEDPFVTLETLAPYVVTTHVRDTAVFEHERGAAAQWVALGEGSVDFVRLMEQFRTLCPHSAMHLEIITGRPPRILPYFEPDFWKAFPKTPAWQFARFLALVKSGRPFMGAMVIEDVPGKQPDVMKEALKEQQRIDLERSLDYAKQKLHAGIRWRA